MTAASAKQTTALREVVSEAISAFSTDPAYVIDLSTEAWKIRQRRTKARVQREGATAV